MSHDIRFINASSLKTLTKHFYCYKTIILYIIELVFCFMIRSNECYNCSFFNCQFEHNLDLSQFVKRRSKPKWNFLRSGH